MKIEIKSNDYIFLAILIVALFLRLWHLEDYIVFLGDQGRDVLIVKRILNGRLTLLGPTASVGGFYLGPFYYYLMAIPLFLGGYSPVGPAVMVALFGVGTVVLIYKFTRLRFGVWGSLSAAAAYALSWLAVGYSRFSWNPNTLPFFTLLYFYLLYLASVASSNFLFFSSGIVLGLALQLHYMATALIPLLLFFTFSKKTVEWFRKSLIVFAGATLSFSPFLFFELRHGFSNLKSILEFITRKQGAIGFYPADFIPRLFELSQRIFANFFGLEKGIFASLLICLGLGLVIYKYLFAKNKLFWKIILVWWLGGIVALGLYQGTIYDYYYGYLFPIPALLLGLMVSWLTKLPWGKLAAGILVAVLFYYSAKAQPILKKPNKVLDQTERIAQDIISASGGSPFNFALISAGNSDHAYRYFLEIAGATPTPLEERVEGTLFVVCEASVCEPLGNPLWEIAAFGRAEIASQWTDKVGIKIFRLIHHPDSVPWMGKPAPKG